MLVLSRLRNQSIVINDNITVTVIEIRGGTVRLGIAAPRASHWPPDVHLLELQPGALASAPYCNSC